MTKRKTTRYKKKVQKVHTKDRKKTPKFKYKIVTSTGFPFLKKTSYANNINSAKKNSKKHKVKNIYVI